MNKSGAFRKKKVYFTQVSNNAIRDNELSLKAKGLYSLIQSYITIEDFTLYKNYLKKQCLEGERAFEGAWKELKEQGYLIQYKLRDENEQFYYEYELLDSKDLDFAKDIHSKQNTASKQDKEPVSTTSKKAKSHTLHFAGVENALGAKVGVYNNTIPNNTDLNNTNSNNKKKKEHKGYKAIIEKYTNNLEMQQSIYAFIEMRKANKSTMTDRALSMLLTKLNTVAFSDIEKIEVLNNSVVNCWKSVYALEEKKKDFRSSTKGSEVLDKISKKHSASKLSTFNEFDQRGYTDEDYNFLEVTYGQRDIASINRDNLNFFKNQYDEYMQNNNMSLNWEENNANGIDYSQRVILPSNTENTDTDENKEELSDVQKDMLEVLAK